MKRVGLVSLAFFGGVGLVAWSIFAIRIDQEPLDGYKRLSGTVAEEFAYRDPGEIHPRVTCSACRVGKLKVGLVSLGAFSTLELDDLVVNVPESTKNAYSDEGAARDVATERHPVESIVRTLNLKAVLSMTQTNKKRFAAIKVKGFQLNRMQDENLVPILTADWLRNDVRRLVLKRVTLYREEGPVELPEAELTMDARLGVSWTGGFWDLSAMIQPLREKSR